MVRRTGTARPGAPETARTLTQRELNRALLARQLLLERSTGSIVDAVEQVGGLQAQYAPSGYVGLWSRVAGFQRDELTRALELVPYRGETGAALVDLPGAPLPDGDTPAPVRFLPHWDANLLVHARRAGVLPEAHRPRVFSIKNPFSVGVYLVDGRAAGAWSLVGARIVLDPFENLAVMDERAVEREREALEAFHA